MFLSAALAEGSVHSILGHGNIDDLFKGTEPPVYVFAKEFAKKYGKLPDQETLVAHLGDEGLLTPHKEKAEYYLDLMVLRHVEMELKKGMKKASDLLLPENKNPEKALEEIAASVMALARVKHQKAIVDFRDALDLIMGDYVAKYTSEDAHGLMFGWPSLDDVTGGCTKGDVISMVGRPAQGKTWQMLYGAKHGWNESELPQNITPQSRMFVSMEMTVLPIEQRLAAMQTHVPAGKLKLAALSSTAVSKLKKGLTLIKGFKEPFWVIDGNLGLTVEDIWQMARQLKPDAIFIDGAYLIKHPTERDRFRRVAENADLIKKELAPIAPTVCSWQFARSASKKKKGEKVDLDDIGYTDAIGQVSSIVLGLFQEETAETLVQRRVEILKGRNGETGSFVTNWQFDGHKAMDFSEVKDEPVEELQFV